MGMSRWISMRKDLILAEKPDIMMLQETKCATKEMDRLLPYCCKKGKETSTMAKGIVVDLDLLWNPNTAIIENFIITKWSIMAAYRLIGSNKPGHLSNVYGPTSSRVINPSLVIWSIYIP
jgi:hypothetical protein